MATSLLWIGAEDLDFLPINGAYGDLETGDWSTIFMAAAGVSHNGGVSLFRPAFARCALCPDIGVWIRSANLGVQGSLWCAGQVLSSSNADGAGTNDLIRWVDAAGVVRLVIEAQNPNRETLLLVTVSGTGARTQIASSTSGLSPVNASTPDRIDAKLVYAVAGTFDLWINGTLAMTFAGDVTAGSGLAGINYVDFGKMGTGSGGPYNNNFLTGWSECFASTTDSRAISGIVTVPPAGDGATAQWAGTYANVDGLLYVDSTVISTTAAGQLQQLTTATAMPAGSFAVDSVWTSVRAQAGSTAPQHLETGLHVAGADYFGASVALSPAMGLVQQVWSDNPATAAPWTAANVQSGLVGISLESLA